MLAKRIIPCLDVDKGRVVKGVTFTHLKDAGDPVELAKFYNKENADELVFLDITASHEERRTMVDVIKKVAKVVFIPFTVGGGIKTTEDIKNILSSGADKIAINSAAITNPSLITEAANMFGSQCVVVAIDAKRENNTWVVYTHGGRRPTQLDAIEWARSAVSLGAGEILLTSIDADGTKKGYDLELTKKISQNISVPVIASGGAGSLDDFVDVFTKGYADGALAASLFHFGELTINQVKEYVSKKKIPVRINL